MNPCRSRIGEFACRASIAVLVVLYSVGHDRSVPENMVVLLSSSLAHFRFACDEIALLYKHYPVAELLQARTSQLHPEARKVCTE